MRTTFRSAACHFTILALVLAVSPAPMRAALPGGAGLDGIVVGLDGRPAAGYEVHLIDPAGNPAATSTTGADGQYGFSDVPAGEYGLAVENAAGGVAPVLGPPVRLGRGELARRDLKLLQGDPATQPAFSANYSAGQWWASLSPAAKAWTVVAIVVVVGVTAQLLTDDDASPFDPNAVQ